MKWVINIKWFKKCSITIRREQESIKNPKNKYAYASFHALIKYGENFYGIFMSRIDTPSNLFEFSVKHKKYING